jgi:hypothetical protein
VKKGMIYDPPSGWMYGFPKQYMPLDGESFVETLVRDGYPIKDAEWAQHHTRFWGQPIENKEDIISDSE